MTFARAELVGALLGDRTRTPSAVADLSVEALERLAAHLSRVVGDTGIQTLYRRSLMLASDQLPWLAAARANPPPAGGNEYTGLRDAMAQQSLAAATEAFVVVLSTLLDLLGRLIGEALVMRLLYEVWPVMVPQRDKELL